jgi:hypothetical protein
VTHATAGFSKKCGHEQQTVCAVAFPCCFHSQPLSAGFVPRTAVPAWRERTDRARLIAGRALHSDSNPGAGGVQLGVLRPGWPYDTGYSRAKATLALHTALATDEPTREWLGSLSGRMVWGDRKAKEQA